MPPARRADAFVAPPFPRSEDRGCAHLREACLEDALDAAAPDPGERVLCWGRVRGADLLTIAVRVGPNGRVMWVRTGAESPASREATAGPEAATVHRVRAVGGRLDVDDDSVDVIATRCALVGSSDRSRLWSEIVRVLRPGGRVTMAETALVRPLPASFRELGEDLPPCVTAAPFLRDLELDVAASGLVDAWIARGPRTFEPSVRRFLDAVPPVEPGSALVARVEISARKP